MTGTHPVNQEEVMAWLDGELAPARVDEVAAHVEACAECRALAEDLRHVSARTQVWTIEPAPAMPSPSPLRRFRTRTIVVGAGAALAAAAGITVLAFVQRGRTLPPLAPEPFAMSQADRPAQREAMPAEGQATASVQMGISTRSVEPETQGQVGEVRMMARTARLELATDAFGGLRDRLGAVVSTERGDIASISTGGEPRGRWLRASVRIPSARLDAALASLRGLGTVKQEWQASEDVTDSFRDLTVRIRNARIEEQRLNELLKQRTGTVKDILEVEQHIARVRTDLERMESEALATRTRVEMATIRVEINEIYKAELAAPIGALPVTTQMWNALIDGTRQSVQMMLAVLLGVLEALPVLLPWVVIAAAGWRAMRRRRSRAS